MTDLRSRPVKDVASLQALVGGEPHPIVEKKIFDHVEERSAAFIEGSPFLLLATSDCEGRQDVSPKGDAPGFAWLENERTLWIPDRPGNKLAYGLKNILENPRAGVLFLMPGTEETVRVNGRAEIHAAPEVLEKFAARGKRAIVAIRIEVEECFFHCAKAFKRSKLWKQESWPERFRLSFGELMAPRIGGGKKEAAQIDEIVEQDYRDGL